jgi:hypothetical protein
MAASAIGKHRAKKAAEKAAKSKKSALQNVMDFNYNADMDWQKQNMGNFQNIMAQASQPQTTSSSQWSDTTEDSEKSMDFGAEGNQAAADVLLAARNAPFEVNNLLAEQQAAANRAISGDERRQKSQIKNVAASRGVDPRLMSIGMEQPFASRRLEADLGTKQQAYANRVGAYGNIAGVLKNLFQKDISHSRQQMKGGGKTTGPADFGAMMGAIQAGRPVHKEFADVQGGKY